MIVRSPAARRRRPAIDARPATAHRAAVPARRPLRTTTLATTLAALSACAGLDPLTVAESERLDTFDFYWQALRDDYPLFGQQPVDWNELRQRYRAAVPFARSPHEFYHLLTGMLSELGDPHVSLEVPDERFAADGIAPTSLLDLPDFELMPIEGRMHVVGWPAHRAPTVPEGMPERSYPELWRVEGFPVVLPLVGNLLLGPPSSPVELQLRWQNGVITRHVVARPVRGTRQRRTPLAHLASQGPQVQLLRSEPFTWLALDRLSSDVKLDDLDRAIDRARETDGLVLDLRRNLGGLFLVAKHLVERFLPHTVETVLAPPHPTSTWFGLFEVEVFLRNVWEPRAPRFDKPLVVLTSAQTGSSAEHTARMLQRYCGAVVVGERTIGAEAVVQVADGPDGGQLRFGSTRVLDRTGVGLQQDGVAPDISVRLTLADVERLGPQAAVADWERRLLAAAQRCMRQR